MTVRAWFDGRLVPADAPQLSVLDHGFTVGDGVFETLKVTDGVPFALARHLGRLARSAEGLGFAAPDLDVARGAVEEVLAADDLPPLARLRITYAGGVAPIGSGRGSEPPHLVVTLAAAQPWPATTSVVTVPWTRNERSAVAGLKTTSYAENVVAVERAHTAGASEALFANTRDELCEGTGSNVFVVLDGELVTPPLSGGCLAGITRELVLEWFGGSEKAIPFGDLARADEVFLTSSTRDVHPVASVDGRALDAPGPITRQAADAFAARSAELVDP